MDELDELDEKDRRLMWAVLVLPDPVVTAPELSDEVGITSQAVNPRMGDLVELGLVEEKRAGRARLYYYTPKGREAAYRLFSDVLDSSGSI